MMQAVQGVVSQYATSVPQTPYVDEVLVDNPLILLTVENDALVSHTSYEFQVGYPAFGGTPSFGAQLVRSLPQSLQNANTSGSTGTGACFRIASSTALANTHLSSVGTVEMWLLFETTQSARPLSLHDSTYLFTGTSTSHPVSVRGLTTTPANLEYSFALATAYHVVMTWDSGSLKLYVNGIEQYSGTYTGTGGFNTSALILGAGRTGTGATTVKGLMQAPALYTTALDASRVLAHYNAGAL